MNENRFEKVPTIKVRQTEYSPLVDKRGVWINAFVLMIAHLRLQVMVVASAIKNRWHYNVHQNEKIFDDVYMYLNTETYSTCLSMDYLKKSTSLYLGRPSGRPTSHGKLKTTAFCVMFGNQEVQVFLSSHWIPITNLALNWWSKMEYQGM